MAKPKRMSDIFASSAEKSSAFTPAPTATPYSSEGPTLPLACAAPEHTHNTEAKRPVQGTSRDGHDNRAHRQSKIQKTSVNDSQPAITSHPALYEPWTLLRTDTFKLVTAQKRLRGTRNVVPIVFTKNQSVKAGINRIKILLGAYHDNKSSFDTPNAINEKDCIISLSAQGDGTAKLVSIVDMARRVVAPTSKEKELGEDIDIWWLYTSLASVEVVKKRKDPSETKTNGQPVETDEAMQEEVGEADAFEPTEAEKADRKEDNSRDKMIKTPVLTVWITKKEIPAFKSAFGGEAFEVKTLPRDD